MATTFKRFGEKVKQALGVQALTSKEKFLCTSNGRNLAMIAETRKFAVELKGLYRDLSAMEKSISAGLSTVASVMNTPLPRAFDGDETGKVGPCDKEERLVGGHVDVVGLGGASRELRARMQAEVLHPLEEWLAAYRSIKERNKRCEELRLDLDTARRQAQASHERFLKLKEKNHKDAEEAMLKAQTDEDKTNRMGHRFSAIEAEIFNALRTLIQDTTVLREYAAMGMEIMQRCFMTTHTCFDLDTPMPVLMLPAPAVPMFALPSSSLSNSEAAAGFRKGSASMGGAQHSPLAAARTNTTPRNAISAGGASGGPATPIYPAIEYRAPTRAPPSPNSDAASGARAAAPLALPAPAAAKALPASDSMDRQASSKAAVTAVCDTDKEVIAVMAYPTPATPPSEPEPLKQITDLDMGALKEPAGYRAIQSCDNGVFSPGHGPTKTNESAPDMSPRSPHPEKGMNFAAIAEHEDSEDDRSEDSLEGSLSEHGEDLALPVPPTVKASKSPASTAAGAAAALEWRTVGRVSSAKEQRQDDDDEEEAQVVKEKVEA